MDQDKYLSPEEVCELIPGMTKGTLAQLRLNGNGPTFRKPTPKKVIYKESEVIAWIESTARTTTTGH